MAAGSGVGKAAEADQVFSCSLIMGVSLALLAALLTAALCPFISLVLGARDPVIYRMTTRYIYGYLIGFPFFTLMRVLTPYLQMDGEYRRRHSVPVYSGRTTGRCLSEVRGSRCGTVGPGVHPRCVLFAPVPRGRV